MKVIFLDIDGVLATRRAWSNQPADWKRGDKGEFYEPITKMFEDWLIQHPDVFIVLSSTWRLGLPSTKFPWLYWHTRIGKESTIIRDRIIATTGSTGSRADEISRWISTHPVSDFCIVDDDGKEFARHWTSEYFVNPDGRLGLTRANLKEVERILKV